MKLAAVSNIDNDLLHLKEAVVDEIDTHRWLGIREADGTTYWEISSDGITWDVFHSELNSDWVYSIHGMQVEASVEHFAALDATVSTLANFNIAGTVPKSRRHRILMARSYLTEQVIRTARGRALIFRGGAVTAGGVAYTQTLSGTLTMSGAHTKFVDKFFVGTLTSSGTHSKMVSKFHTGTLTMAGALTKLTAKFHTGTLTFIGGYAESTRRVAMDVFSDLRGLYRQIRPTGPPKR